LKKEENPLKSFRQMAKKKASNSSNSNLESEQTSDDKKTLIILSFPIVILFNLIKSLLYECFVLFKFVFNSSLQVFKSRRKETNEQSQQPQINNQEEEVRLEAGEDIFRIQKYHHKRAFEFISKALKIDETTIQYPGN
jgi:spastin